VSIRGGCGLGGGGGASTTGAGGGGAAAATFFLHPEAASNRVAANTVALSVLMFILILNVLMPSMNFDYHCLRFYSIPLAHTG
jgi:hypothetical protein